MPLHNTIVIEWTYTALLHGEDLLAIDHRPKREPYSLLTELLAIIIVVFLHPGFKRDLLHVFPSFIFLISTENWGSTLTSSLIPDIHRATTGRSATVICMVTHAYKCDDLYRVFQKLGPTCIVRLYNPMWRFLDNLFCLVCWLP